MTEETHAEQGGIVISGPVSLHDLEKKKQQYFPGKSRKSVCFTSRDMGDQVVLVMSLEKAQKSGP